MLSDEKNPSPVIIMVVPPEVGPDFGVIAERDKAEW